MQTRWFTTTVKVFSHSIHYIRLFFQKTQCTRSVYVLICSDGNVFALDWEREQHAEYSTTSARWSMTLHQNQFGSVWKGDAASVASSSYSRPYAPLSQICGLSFESNDDKIYNVAQFHVRSTFIDFSISPSFKQHSDWMIDFFSSDCKTTLTARHYNR